MPKARPAYWRRRLFKPQYTYRGRRCQARNWAVKIQYHGTRRTFTLHSPHPTAAAEEACELYRRILTDGWGRLGTAGDRWPKPMEWARLDAAGVGLEIDYLHPGDWAQRLVTRMHTMKFQPEVAPELTVHVQHAGTRGYFPLGTADRVLAARRARRIHATVVEHGWPAANTRFRRELTVAFRWTDNPLAWTYTTVHAQKPTRDLRAGRAIWRKTGARGVVVVESDPSIRAALVLCLNHMSAFGCAGDFASTSEARRDLGPRPGRFFLVNTGFMGIGGNGFSELQAAFPHCLALPYSVFEDSEELFRATPGGAGTYLLIRTPSAGFLEPMAACASLDPLNREILADAVGQYFKNAVATLPIGGPARQLAELTQREQEVLGLLSNGYTDKEIALRLRISIHTVHEHTRNIFEKLGVHNRTEAVVKFLQK
jgi:DNA-binding NarL/FixJ family response regulator